MLLVSKKLYPFSEISLRFDFEGRGCQEDTVSIPMCDVEVREGIRQSSL